MRPLPDPQGGLTPNPSGKLSDAGRTAGASILRSRLFLKYVGLFVAVVSLVLVANSLFDVYFSYQEQKTALVRIQREQAEAAAGKIGQFISEIESQVGWTTQLPWSAGTLEQRRFDALRLLRQVPAITELAEIDSTGHEQLRVSRLAMEVVGSGNDVSHEPAFTEAVAHKVYYGLVYFRRESEPYMTLSLAGTRRDAGVSIAQVNLKLIWDVLSKIKFAGHGRAYVVDGAGRLIAHPDISLVLRNTDMSQLAQVRAARAKVAGKTDEEVREATDIEGHRVLTASAPVAPLNWLVFVETPIEEAYAPFYATIERAGLVLLGALALAFAAGMFLARRMAVPIQALRAGAARLGSGDLSQRIGIKTGDEVEALADQFNDMAGRLQESYTNLEQKVEARTQELSESLEQQTATSEVLGVISSSPGDLTPVFRSILENATRLCEANFGVAFLVEGDRYRTVAMHNTPPAFTEARQRDPWVGMSGNSALARVAATRMPVRVDDVAADATYQIDSQRRGFVEQTGARSILDVPLLKDNQLVGAINVYRTEVRPFSDKQVELLQNFAAQAVIAIENTRLLTELRVSLDQQTATSDVLRVISSSQGDLKPVFESILANAVRICGAEFGNLALVDGEGMVRAASYNPPPEFETTRRSDPRIRLEQSPLGSLYRTKQTVNIADLGADPTFADGPFYKLARARAVLCVPMLKEDTLIGALVIYRLEPMAFGDKQTELLTNFAAQAVIAIENARLLNELRESLEQQTATSEVLEVISRSAFDLQAVFETVVERSARLSGADRARANVFRFDGELLRIAATFNVTGEVREWLEQHPIRPGQHSGSARAALERRTIHIPDVLIDPEYTYGATDVEPYRTILAVPILKADELLGVLLIYVLEVKPFTDKQIALVETFADQAAIAIENVRLFEAEQERTKELTVSLEQQTATSDVLQVISSSPGELDPVFQTILANATRLCEANFGILPLYEGGENFRITAMYNVPPAFAELRRREPVFRTARTTRLAVTKQFVHVADILDDEEGNRGDAAAFVKLTGARTLLLVPMLKEAELIGAIAIYRREVRPFTDKQIELVKNFAAQAVIAIENARLLTELRERTDALGRSVGELRALGEVSQAVNSTLDLETVLATITAKSVQLSNTDAGAIYVFDDTDREFHLRATYGMDRELIDALGKQHISLEEQNVALVLAQREPVQVPDLSTEAPNAINEITLRAGFRARLTAPLIRGRDVVGMLVVRRRAPGAFPQNTVDLIKTFAAQSVLAIQNARLFHEIEDKSRELEVAGQHKSQFLANMSHELRTPLNAIIGYSEILQEEVSEVGQQDLVPDLKKIEGAGRHLLGLINDILDLSKVEAGKMDLFLEDVDIIPLLEEVRTLIVPLAEKNGNTLVLKPAKKLGIMHTDRTKLKQSLLNILSNGSKFTENGKLTLVADLVKGDRDMVRFAVTDTGIGMTEDQLGRLFQAFSQADASTTKKYGGTGLGLAISRQFCQLLGGDITVTSKPGKGSTFTITLPVRSEAPTEIKPVEAPRIAADPNGSATVLIVDDDPAARELLTAALKGAGYRLVHATGGAEALAMARTIRPDAITLDVMMPKPDGWDVLGALKADAELCDIPVIIVTVAPDRGVGLSLGAVEVLTKPVDRARLTELIHRVVRRDGPILVVEDDADTREMMRHTIEKMGLEVAEAVNGRRALTWLGEHEAPAMILLDLMMPEMDGFEFLDALTARAEWRAIPVVVITAKKLSKAERDRLLRQARKVMEKATATKVDIAAAISEAIRRRPVQAPAGAK
jgi:GAF domain-containing protein/DNA-binding response OmpR family regulator/HAMP domain-containing protein